MTATELSALAVAAFTLGLLVVAVLQWKTYTRQAALMREGLEETRKANQVAERNAVAATASAEAAQRGVKIAEQTLVLSQRALLHVVSVSKDGGDVNPTFTIEVVNNGRMSAYVRGWSIAVVDEEFPAIPDETKPQHMEGGNIVPPNGGTVRLDAIVDMSLPQNEWKQVRAGIRPLAVWGIIDYSTGFPDVPGELKFGFEHDSAMTHIGTYWRRFRPTSAPGYNFSN
jgi:hypothetical protein